MYSDKYIPENIPKKEEKIIAIKAIKIVPFKRGINPKFCDILFVASGFHFKPKIKFFNALV
jgi:hypothetical protein